VVKAPIDHLIRAQQHGRWDSQVEHLSCLQVDYELNPSWLFDGKVAGLHGETPQPLGTSPSFTPAP
jgi:hypothetical protein